MKEIAKVVGINLAVLLLATVVIYLSNVRGHENIGFALLMMFWIGLHTVVCLITAIVLFITKRPNYGLAFIIAMLIVPIVGASFCFGGANGMNF